MASLSVPTRFFFFLLLLFFQLLPLFHFSSGKGIPEKDQRFQYHNGTLLHGKTSINLIWYGKFNTNQRAIISDFVSSLCKSTFFKVGQAQPSVSSWWKAIEKYYQMESKKKKKDAIVLQEGKQILDENYSMGRTLSILQILQLAARGEQKDAINVVLTSSDVTVEGFCRSRCGIHGTSESKTAGEHHNKFTYIWVGNPASQCPGVCAWPFHQPVYGPKGTPLVPPNNDVGMDGVVINLASLLAATATNPFADGFFQGPAEAPLEAASACPGVFGKGAYPGYAGKLLVDPKTGASYNAYGINGKKYLLPALFDPSTNSCWTLV
ncbi:PREDICTED: protein EXORDIUM-like [Nelumbo nucifera]|uniref:Protein EXORDIUM-like n=2 Tax=Nelumbo nucifera TaxID=4432 RepID=A0A1U8AXP7_NELNU|nr:PREDICTED: protein EXORDIUM-like [Nelumbo nucifera]DAD21992.1 TPA_asm: hypothetical protein HUJ06_023455 [Nelumbo nucifera]